MFSDLIFHDSGAPTPAALSLLFRISDLSFSIFDPRVVGGGWLGGEVR